MSDDGWTPILRPGGVYCSRLCGCRCKKSDYDRAVTDSEALALRMGEGWKPSVWENGGWRYEVIKGVARLHPSINRNVDPPEISGYLMFFDTKPQIVTSANTPEDALGFAVQDARTIQRRIENDLADLLKETVTS